MRPGQPGRAPLLRVKTMSFRRCRAESTCGMRSASLAEGLPHLRVPSLRRAALCFPRSWRPRARAPPVLLPRCRLEQRGIGGQQQATCRHARGGAADQQRFGRVHRERTRCARSLRLPAPSAAVTQSRAPPLIVEPRVLYFAHCASLCCFPGPSQCCCLSRTHRAGRQALSLL